MTVKRFARMGIPGPPGPPGTDGSPGPPGPPGQSGPSVWLEGSGPPNPTLGVAGDYYIDTDTGNVYIKGA